MKEGGFSSDRRDAVIKSSYASSGLKKAVNADMADITMEKSDDLIRTGNSHLRNESEPDDWTSELNPAQFLENPAKIERIKGVNIATLNCLMRKERRMPRFCNEHDGIEAENPTQAKSLRGCK